MRSTKTKRNTNDLDVSVPSMDQERSLRSMQEEKSRYNLIEVGESSQKIVRVKIARKKPVEQGCRKKGILPWC